MVSGIAGHVRRNLVGYLALLVALSGTSYAAATKLLPANSVGTKQVVNHSLRTVDLSSGAVSALHGRQGPQGPQGPKGDPGAQGAQGPQGLKGDTGPAGSTVAARVRGSTQSTTGGTSTLPTVWPLSGNGWTQGATSPNLLVGEATATAPASCSTSYPEGDLYVYLDGNQIGYAQFSFVASKQTTQAIAYGFASYAYGMPGPGAPKSRQITAKIFDNCPGTDYTFDSFKLDVVSSS